MARIPRRDRAGGVRSFDLPLASRRLRDGLRPARRNETRGNVGKRGQDEQSPAGFRMGDDEQSVGLARVEGDAFGRSLDRQPGTAEHEEIEVELARTPSLAFLAAECPLQLLQGDEQRDGAGRSIGPGRHIEADNGVPEWRLVDATDRRRDVQA